MEPKFINQFELTKELYKERIMNSITNKGVKWRKKMIRYLIFSCIGSVVLIVLGVVWEELLFTLLGVMLILLSLYRVFIQTNRTIRKRYTDLLISNGNKKLFLRYIFADNITVELGRNRTDYDYSEIVKQTEDETCINIFLSFDDALRIRKDSFIVGSADEFKEFIDSVIS